LTRGEQFLDHGRIELSGCQKLGCCLGQLRGSASSFAVGCSVIDANDQHIAASVVNGDVLARLKEAQLAHALSGDARGGEVGDASRLEFDAHVGDVNLWREDGQADGADLADRRGGEREHDVEIVNHEVEDHVYVERAGCEMESRCDSKNMGRRIFDSTARTAGLSARDGRLQNAQAFLCAGDEIVSFRKAGGERLFNQEIESGVEQSRGDLVMMYGGHGDGCGVELQIGGQQLLQWKRRQGSSILTRRRRLGRGRINRGDEGDTEAGGFKFAIDAQMIATKGAGTGNGDPQDGSACYFVASSPSQP